MKLTTIELKRRISARRKDDRDYPKWRAKNGLKKKK